MVPLYNTHLYMHVFVCLHVQVLMFMTGADSYVRGEVTPSPPPSA